MRLWIVFVLVALFAGRADADEVSRVRGHLRTARALLDTRDVSTLTPSQREHRRAAIAVLDRYIDRGIFPRRTTDAYGALRPRFIDDRGVHCAVGEMIASTSPELALEINAQYEFSFVRDMKSPALLAWAHDNGFTVDELAAIQPAYAKSSVDRFGWSEVHAHIQELTLGCIRDESIPNVVELTHSPAPDAIHLTTAGTDEFSRCFASAAEKYVKRPIYPSSAPFAIPTLDFLMQWHVKTTACAPQSGAFPREAKIDFAKGTVATKPENKDVEACLVKQLDETTEPFRRRLELEAHIRIWPHVTSQGVYSALIEAAPKAAWSCASHHDPEQINLVVHAKEGDGDFDVSVPGANEAFSACVRFKVLVPLRALISSASGNRIDSDIDVSLPFKLVRQARVSDH